MTSSEVDRWIAEHERRHEKNTKRHHNLVLIVVLTIVWFSGSFGICWFLQHGLHK